MDIKERVNVYKNVSAHIHDIKANGYAEKKLEDLTNIIDDAFAEALSSGNYRYNAYGEELIEKAKKVLVDNNIVIFDSDGEISASYVLIETECIIPISYITDETGALMTITDPEILEMVVENKLNDRYGLADTGTFHVSIDIADDFFHVITSIIRK